ncbi:TonB-dependent receptor plug [Rhodomicrobium vannielii ATCC 17100]|uniref:TonB-dependent receptor plug n=1 Tax=Rhodomicrobium vannielii (strain ATCC 17100 / DSM 162 / LMG 4299 / NCIMB 10020 / ATH 3.1.1) TaxID=648757 RepID=E3HYZ6_RHOVT|nr:TonB-dependent receptor plug domain-containing protein [Rhodomicrobium vannielii]ADP70971.1 TonB-dependent receptor plug [Rhodomicrobium vannielii ATCC 17100]
MSKVIIAVLGTAAAGLCAEQAVAQSTDRPSTLPPIVVNAEKAKKPGKKKATPSTEANGAAEAVPQDLAEPEPQTLAKPLSGTVLSGAALTEARPGERDAAALLTAAPGVAVATGGGVSALPAINGLGDERIRTELNGMLITSACANRMNPALSYVDPSAIGKVEVNTALAPVSKGGDSIGGTISVERAPANFATVPGEVLTAATLTTFYRSNGDGFGGSVHAEAATQNLNATYNGAWSQSRNYERGGGEEVRSTEYEAGNHALTLTARDGRDLYVLEGTYQKIPYQGFVNQRMDLTDNQGWAVNARALQHYGWGTLDARAYYQRTLHEMNFLADKGGNMPMNTDGSDFGYSVKAEILTSPRDKVRIGNEFHGQTLDDWWPPVAGMAMMGPDTYENINGGTRARVGTFAEWERKWTPEWSTLLGARNDIVWMDTGDVRPYSWTSMMQADDIAAATAFNARDHARTDVNFDLTALARYEPNAASAYEFGYARKTRSPNLYERYSWGKGMMASTMIGWFGDGNGYVGNLDLDPEVAHTVSATAAWRTGPAGEYEVKVTPFYSYVEDFIDVNYLKTFTTSNFQNGKFRQFQFANHDAELYGVNVSGKAPLWASADYGRFGVNSTIGWVEGERTDGVNLYRIMPLNARAALTHSLGNWSSTAEVQLVASKDQVQSLRNEFETPGYALLNLRTSYLWSNVRFDLAVENVFDKLYYQPLGGFDYADFKATSGAEYGAVAGVGRSFNAAVTVKF